MLGAQHCRICGPFLVGAAVALVCLLLGVPHSSQAADRIYTIKRGDTLSGIASKHRVSVSELAKRNDLEKNAHVYAGRRLVIPSREPSAKAAVALPPSIQRAIAGAPVRAGRWRYIVVHHSGTSAGTVQSMDRYHREKRHMENGLAYHFVIGNGNGMPDGQIFAGRRWIKQLDGGHLASERQNRNAIGICLVGDFDRQSPTAKQMRSLRALVQSLMERCRLPATAVKTHREINVVPTHCPGSRFNVKAFKSSL